MATEDHTGIIVPIFKLKPNYEFPTKRTERYIDDIRKRIEAKFAQMQVEIDEQDEERALLMQPLSVEKGWQKSEVPHINVLELIEEVIQDIKDYEQELEDDWAFF